MSTVKNPAGYYEDIEADFDEIVLKSAMLEDIFYLKDLKQRKLFISDDISQETIGDAVRHIMQINREDADIPVDERLPILLYVTSNGVQ